MHIQANKKTGQTNVSMWHPKKKIHNLTLRGSLRCASFAPIMGAESKTDLPSMTCMGHQRLASWFTLRARLRDEMKGGYNKICFHEGQTQNRAREGL